ncbi:MAG: metallophosphoesterase [Treponema sp.]|nr:metallophosphoesterase [Treponema sp.]
MKFTKVSIIFSSLILAGSILFAAPKKADIIFTHDIHSFLRGTARAKTLIDRQKAKNPDTLVVDAGDFSMGTLYQTIFTTQASELKILGELGVEATTLGNHEFDYGAEALGKMFTEAGSTGLPVPALTVCNIDWNKDNEYTKILKETMLKNYGCKNYQILQKGDVKIALIGVFGEDSFFCSPTCELTFTNQYEAVKNTVAEVKAKENPDLIVALSHCGVFPDPKKSEDEILARKVPELDVIISGHTHLKLEKPIIIGETIIGSCEAYSKYLGNISLTQKENGRWQLDEYRLDSLTDEKIPEDKGILSDLDYFDTLVDKEYLSLFGYTSKSPLVNCQQELDIITETGYCMAEQIHTTLKNYKLPGDIVVVPEGVIRGTYKEGVVRVSDVFESYSLGIGPDGITGYPLLAMYFTGKELKNIAEIDCSVSPILKYVRLYIDGLSYEYNPHRVILDKVTDVKLVDYHSGEKIAVEDEKLYCVVTDLYTGNMIGGVMNMTKGLVALVPKDKNGNVPEKLEDLIIYQPDGTELKGWVAIAKGLRYKSWIGTRDYLSEAIVANPSWNPVNLLKNPSKVGLIIRCVIIILLVIIGISVWGIIVGVKRRKAKKAQK